MKMLSTEKLNEQNSLKNTMLILSTMCFSMLMLSLFVPLLIFYIIKPSDFFQKIISLGATSIISIFVPSLLVKKYFNNTNFKIHTSEKSGKLSDFLFVLLGFALCIIVNYAVSFFTQNGQTLFSGIKNDIVQFFALVVVVGIIPAVFEEFAFRGVAFSALSRFGDKTAIIISALMFAFVHTSVNGIIFAFISGIILGTVRKNTSSLICCISIHFLNNLYGIISIFAVMNFESSSLETANIIAFLFCLAAAFICLVVLKIKNGKIFLPFRTGSVLSKKETIKTLIEYPYFIAVVILTLIIIFNG